MKILKKIIITVLTLEARLILAKYKPFIIAVTGSVGKTSTKDAIYDTLKGHSKFVRKSYKSMNSEIGLPLTIIGAPNAWYSLKGWLNNIFKGFVLIIKKTNYPDCLVLEVGADHPGDIKRVAKWLRPNIAVITRISRTPVHVEFFKSPEEVFEEKASLATSVRNGGIVVLFADDEKILTIKDMVKSKNVDFLTYGLDQKADIRGSSSRILYNNSGNPCGVSFVISSLGKDYAVELNNVIGNTYFYPILASVAVAKARGIDINEAVKSLNNYDAPKGRMNIISGINDSVIIDDSYNSSPDAIMSALETLKEINCPRKIAVLGDMMELGKYSSTEHRKVGREVANIVSELVTVGGRSISTADEAVKSGLSKDNVHSFDNSILAGEYLSTRINKGDLILVKGSQFVRMERVVYRLLKEPEKADKLLVRQEKEWLDRN